MNFIFPTVWLLACAFSVDETTMGFKGPKNEDKERITYKAAGGWISVGCLMPRRLHISDSDEE